MKTSINALTIYIILLPLLFGIHSAQAALNDPCGCNAGLAPELIKYSSSSQVQLAFIKQIDEKQYDKIRKDGSTDTNIIDLISGSASYSEFNEKRHAYLSKANFSLNAEESESLLFNTVNTADWGACKRQCIKSQQGFICDIADFTEKNIAISCSWRPEGGAALNRPVKVIVNGTELTPQEKIYPYASRDWQLKREPKQELLITLTLENGPSQTLKILATPPQLPPLPPHPPEPTPVKLGSCIGKGGLNGVQFWGPKDAPCNGIPEWGTYITPFTESAPAPAQVCSCTGHGGVNGVRLWGPEGHACGGIAQWGTYSDQCISASSLIVCGGIGHGKILANHVLWGPKGKASGGLWDPYNLYCVEPS